MRDAIFAGDAIDDAKLGMVTGDQIHERRQHDRAKDGDHADDQDATPPAAWRGTVAEAPLWAPTWAITQPALSTCCSSSRGFE